MVLDFCVLLGAACDRSLLFFIYIFGTLFGIFLELFGKHGAYVSRAWRIARV